MEGMEDEMADRAEATATLVDEVLRRLEGKLTALQAATGEVVKMSAMVEQSRREEELAARLAEAERELAELRANAALPAACLSTLRRTIPAGTSEMLAKRGIGDGPVDVRMLDAALTGLSLEQRIAVKTQLLRAGAIA